MEDLSVNNWSLHVQSETNPQKIYEVKKQDGILSCTCTSWKKQYAPIHKRTCKHLKKILGDSNELRRAPRSYFGCTRKKNAPCPALGKEDPVLDKPPLRTWSIEERPMRFHRWEEKHGITGYYASLKMNGAFGRWTDGKLYTKSGRELHPPKHITSRLPPDSMLDGEIYAGKKGMQSVRKALSDVWDEKVQFIVFDAPSKGQPFVQRMKRLYQLQQQYHFPMVEHREMVGSLQWQELRDFVTKEQEEGLVLRYAHSKYDGRKRSHTDLKWKPWMNSEGKVQERIKRKKGVTLIVKEKGVREPFRIYDAKGKMSDTFDHVYFRYAGRDEKGRPEIPVLLREE